MQIDAAGATSADVLRLVQRALEEIDVAEVDATLRRTVRIASLLGDTRSAIRLGLELKPSGGHPPANAEMTRRLMADPSVWGTQGGDDHDAIEEYIAERTVGEDQVSGHSIAEIHFWLAERLPRDEMTADAYARDLDNRTNMIRHLERARHHAFTLLCRWERQLTFATIQDDALAAVRSRVDVLLATSAHDVLDAFNLTFRRLREVAETESPAAVGELLSQAVSSCRRILKFVVDAVEPATPERAQSDSGHSLKDDAYKNRLVEFLRRTVASSSFRYALVDDGESLFRRFSVIDALASKGVHARVAAAEAEFCALHTYLLAGEILLLNEPDDAARNDVLASGAGHDD
jgi:hypothetical protein